jgi:hypothetical protein
MTPGIVWAPYIMAQTVSVVSHLGTSSFAPKQVLKSRYSTIWIKSKNLIRKDKIEKIKEKTLD